MRVFLILATVVFGVVIFTTPRTNPAEHHESKAAMATSIPTRVPERPEGGAAQVPNRTASAAASRHEFPSMPAGSESGSEEALLGVRRAAELDAQAVADWWHDLPPGPFREQALEQLVIAWAHSDLVGVSLWCLQLEKGPEREMALKSLSYEAARSDPRTSLDLAVVLENPDARNAAVAHAFSQWASSEDLEVAGGWALEIENAPIRETILGELALVMAERDGRSAAELVATQISRGVEQSTAAVGVVQRWAQKEPALAANWIARFPDGQVLKDAAFELMSVWVGSKPEEVKDWFALVPEGAFRNACAEALATLEYDGHLH